MSEAATDLPIVLAHASTGRITGQDDVDALFLMFRGYFEARNAGEKQGALAPVHQTGNAEADRRQAIAAGMKARMQAARDGMTG